MATILQLTSIIFGENGEYSRLSSEFVSGYPNARVIRRDLGKEPIPHLDGERFGAFLSKAESRTPEQQAILDQSNVLIGELQAAYLETMLGFLGITEVEFIHAEGLAVSKDKKEAGLAAARRALRALTRPERMAA
jgi:FMN-dependent NADH-azoreductase